MYTSNNYESNFAHSDWFLGMDQSGRTFKYRSVSQSTCPMSAAEIRSRYLNAERDLQRIDTHSSTLQKLIRSNDPIGMYEFLASIPRNQLIPLLNSKLEDVDLTPISYAIRCSASHLILVMLLRSGAVFENGLISSQGDHPLLQAIRAGNVTFVKILLAVNANVNVLDGEGFSILHWACRRGNVLLARLIVNNPDFSFHNHDRNASKISPLGKTINANKSMIFSNF